MAFARAGADLIIAARSAEEIAEVAAEAELVHLTLAAVGAGYEERHGSLKQREVAFDFPRRNLAVVLTPFGFLLVHEFIVDYAK